MGLRSPNGSKLEEAFCAQRRVESLGDPNSYGKSSIGPSIHMSNGDISRLQCRRQCLNSLLPHHHMRSRNSIAHESLHLRNPARLRVYTRSRKREGRSAQNRQVEGIYIAGASLILPKDHADPDRVTISSLLSYQCFHRHQGPSAEVDALATIKSLADAFPCVPQ
jgi:hypothetical protein